MPSNKWERDLTQWLALNYGKKIVPELFQNAQASDGYPGMQAAMREILHSQETACVLMDSSTQNLIPSGAVGAVSVGNGYIMTKDSSGNSVIVYCTATAAPIDINVTTKCIVASNNGTITLKDKTSVLSTDVIIAIRGDGSATMLDVRNLQREDDILTFTTGAIRVGTITTDVLAITGASFRILRSGDSIATALAAMASPGTILLMPGAYSVDASFTISNATAIHGFGRGLVTITSTITASADTVIKDVTITGRVVVGNVNFHVENCDITNASASEPAINQNDMDTGTKKTMRVINCNITSAANGIRLGESQTQADGYRQDAYIINTFISAPVSGASNATGIFIYSPIDHLTVLNCQITACVGIYVWSSVLYHSHQMSTRIMNCVIYGINDLTNGFGIQMITGIHGTNLMDMRITVDNVHVEGSFNSGIIMSSIGMNISTISGCSVSFIGSNNSAGYGIQAAMMCKDCTITNNSGGAKSLAAGFKDCVTLLRCFVSEAASSPVTSHINYSSGFACNVINCSCEDIVITNAAAGTLVAYVSGNSCVSISVTAPHGSGLNNSIISDNNCSGAITCTSGSTDHSVIGNNRSDTITTGGHTNGNYITAGWQHPS